MKKIILLVACVHTILSASNFTVVGGKSYTDENYSEAKARKEMCEFGTKKYLEYNGKLSLQPLSKKHHNETAIKYYKGVIKRMCK